LTSSLITRVTSLTVSQKIVPDTPSDFIVTVEAFVHTSLDLYSFIAITGSSSTLHGLIEMVRVDNNRRQRAMDETGDSIPRKLKV
jgi:hypothetical protein